MTNPGDAAIRRAHPSTLPASGAWRPGDPVAARCFVRIAEHHPFVLEGGGVLGPITLAFETWGTLDATGDNAVLLCHPLTGDAHAAGTITAGQPTPGWWDGLIGAGRALDTDRLFVVCVNVLGGCQGSTGPATPHPDDGRPYGPRFPVVSIRDMTRTGAAVADHLGVRRWLSVIGGSMGGMQVLEWGVMYPDRVRSLVPIATCAAATAQQIGWWSTGRRAIRMDPRWQAGDYYDAAPGDGPHEGLAIARSISQITFRSDDVFTDRFGREVVESLDGFSLWQRFEVERYLEYHGDKLARRFDANSYLLLTKAMDLHDIGRGRGGPERACRRLAAPVLSLSVSSDSLYPSYQNQEICDLVSAAGGRARHAVIDSPHGHDGFLLESAQVGAIVAEFLETVEKTT